jgi:hypothetical protein
LEEAGYGVGHRMLELLAFRERQYRRETKLIGVLQFVSSTVWKALFNKVADSLERSTENEDEYMIHEREPITNAYVSAPADMSQLNCAAYIAGIISGVLNGASFVSLHWAVQKGGDASVLEERGCLCRPDIAAHKCSQMRTWSLRRII